MYPYIHMQNFIYSNVPRNYFDKYISILLPDINNKFTLQNDCHNFYFSQQYMSTPATAHASLTHGYFLDFAIPVCVHFSYS